MASRNTRPPPSVEGGQTHPTPPPRKRRDRDKRPPPSVEGGRTAPIPEEPPPGVAREKPPAPKPPPKVTKYEKGKLPEKPPERDRKQPPSAAHRLAEPARKDPLAALKRGPKVAKEDLLKDAPPWAKPGELTTRSKQILAKDKFRGEKRFVKSLVPGLLTKEDWPNLSTTDKAAYIAGDIGQTILYVTIVGGVIKGVLARSAAPRTTGTFPRDVPGLRTLTRAEVKQQLKDLAAKNRVKPKDLKDTVPLDRPVKTPSGTVYIVQEGPAGQLYVKAARRYTHPDAPRVTPPSGIKTTTRPKVAPKGSGVAQAPPSPATMTLAQLLRQLGIDPGSLSAPKPIPFSTKYPGEAPKPTTLPRPKQPPKTYPEPKPQGKPLPKPALPPSIERGITALPKPKPAPGKGPAKAPGPAPTPAPTPTPTPAPAPAPAPQPKPILAEIIGKPPPKKVSAKGVPPKGVVPGFILPPAPGPGAPDKEKREYIQKVQGFVARRRGALGGKSVWRINYYPYGKGDELVILGPAPKGAKLATGKGSVARSATLLKGVPPKKPIYSDTGAIDDIISSEGKHIVIRSVQDKNIATRHALER